MENIWGGPLPGKVNEIQEVPARVAILGYPPLRITEAFGITHNIPASFTREFILYLENRWCALYAREAGLIPLPALPAGSLLAINSTGRILTHYDDPADIINYKIYVQETGNFNAREVWGDMVPDCPDPPDGYQKGYGLVYSPTSFAVTEVKVYYQRLDLLSPQHLERRSYRPPSKEVTY